MAFTVKVLLDNTVQIFKDSDTAPFVTQPAYPNGDAFESSEAAQAWGEMFVESLEVEDALMPPFGRGLERAAKSLPQE